MTTPMYWSSTANAPAIPVTPRSEVRAAPPRYADGLSHVKVAPGQAERAAGSAERQRSDGRRARHATIAGLVRERWPGARLTELAHLAGDFSSRRYLRATLAGGGAPRTTVVMVLAGSGLPLSSEELGVFPEPLRELPFVDVHRLLTAIGAAVPEIYVAAVERGCCSSRTPATPCSGIARERRAGRGGSDLPSGHRRAADPARARHRPSRPRRSLAFKQGLDERLLQWELEHFLEWGVERRLRRSRSPAPRGAVHGELRRHRPRARGRRAGAEPSRLPQLEHPLARRAARDHRLPGRVPRAARVRRRLAADRPSDAAPRRSRDGGAPSRLLLVGARPAPATRIDGGTR